MIDQVLLELVEFVKGASPVIWEALYRQVYVEALGGILWSVGLFCLSAILFRLGKFCYGQHTKSYDSWDIAYVFSYFSAGASSVIAFGLLVSAVKYLANPEFYAIRFILQSIK